MLYSVLGKIIVYIFNGTQIVVGECIKGTIWIQPYSKIWFKKEFESNSMA